MSQYFRISMGLEVPLTFGTAAHSASRSGGLVSSSSANCSASLHASFVCPWAWRASALAHSI